MKRITSQTRLLILFLCVGVLPQHGLQIPFSLVQAQLPPADVVQYPSGEIAFICGPQLRAGVASNPFPWFDLIQFTKGIQHGEEFPAIGPRQLTGTVSVSQGSRTVTGSGTRFTREVDPNNVSEWYNGRIRILGTDGQTYREVRVASVDSDTQITLLEAWPYATQVNRPADTFHRNPQEFDGWNYDHYYDSAYYDLALVEYINYYRTGDERYRALARKVADSWWDSQWIGSGTLIVGPTSLPPRSMAAAGLMLRALDGRPEMWDWINRKVRAEHDNWVMQRINDSSLYYDLREDGYAQLYAVMLARVLPNTYPLYANGTDRPPTGTATNGAALRASYLADAERAAVQFFGRLQYPNGSWRWNVEGAQLVGIEQPFMVGLYLESAVLLHQLSTNQSVRTNLEQQITRACQHLYTEAFRGSEVVQDMPPFRWRGLWYYYHGGTVSNPSEFERGWGSTMTGADTGLIRQARQLNSTVHHAFGYAYLLTGEERYRQWGDDIFDASFGDFLDEIHGLADSYRAKDYAINYRASGRYLPWRLSGSTPPPPLPARPIRATLSRDASNRLQAIITITNPTANPVPNVRMTLVYVSTLDSSQFVDGAPSPQFFGTVNPGQSVTATVTFAGTAGVPSGFGGLLRVDLSYTGGTYIDVRQVVTP